MQRFVHSADLHLDSPLRGLERYDGVVAEKIRGATRGALVNLVDLCLSEEADLLLIAGDLYDGSWKDYRTGLFFAAQMSRLRAADIPVVIIRGNHDAASQITKSLRLPDNVIELRSSRPETRVLERIGVAVHGQSYATRAVTDDLAAAYPDSVAGLFNIGLLHTSAGGRPGHENYAPCSVATLTNKEYEYWALGHVHKREVISQAPWVVFPGNLQGRHANETGPKGATLVTVDGARVTSALHRTLDTVRWSVCDVDAALEEAVGLAEGRLLAARVVIRGATDAHRVLRDDAEQTTQQIRVIANDLGGDDVWIEKVQVMTHAPIDLVSLAQRDDAIGQLVRSLQAEKEDPDALRVLASELSDLAARLPAAMREGADPLNLDDPSYLADVVGDATQRLVSRLLARERDD
jgi:DNA repair exonuclease SbcCD nuclease subunit